MSFQYGVQQERDWNALSNDEFRQIIRHEFEAHYPSHLRYPPRRLRWHETRIGTCAWQPRGGLPQTGRWNTAAWVYRRQSCLSSMRSVNAGE